MLNSYARLLQYYVYRLNNNSINLSLTIWHELFLCSVCFLYKSTDFLYFRFSFVCSMHRMDPHWMDGCTVLRQIPDVLFTCFCEFFASISFYICIYVCMCVLVCVFFCTCSMYFIYNLCIHIYIYIVQIQNTYHLSAAIYKILQNIVSTFARFIPVQHRNL